MSDALQVAAESLEVDGVEHVAELGGSRRSIVRRVRSGGQTFIVKEYLQPEEMTWSREAAGLTLLDFEFAEIRHHAWEAAYLRAPWPSCWCAWQVPEGLSAIALDAYVGAAFGVHGSPATFERDVDLATLLWCVDTCTWYLRAALEPWKPHNTDDDRIPGRRTPVLSRLDLATRLPGPEPLVGWIGALRTELVARWGEHPLRLAPAFR